MNAALYAFDADAEPAQRLADALGAPLRRIASHAFPDGETLITVQGVSQVALIYRTLDRPNAKLFPLLQAADAARRAGAGRLVLIAPYLPYMRQDMVFAPGQALSRDVLGRLLGEAFERIVTVEPHLHRTRDLSAVFGTAVTVLAAAAELAAVLTPSPDLLVVGPDAESEAWTARLARGLAAPYATFEKVRHGDDQVELVLAPEVLVAGRPVVVVDDICSSGATLIGAVGQLKARGAARIVVAVVHALVSAEAERRLRGAGADEILSTESCPHPTNRVSLTALLARALAQEVAP
ncbi:ribose-phosphate diphosphokinase [Phenylobacterium aquaticum]|uniref:ribose-phosphate diphosphokinase n=1 Tax=Phenylobacterium aquaticum TaxID=1763816 RepID=UPI0026EC4C50|nr:ribose-phosphate diphosphokinase [Phenylobacterium aquaticum]